MKNVYATSVWSVKFKGVRLVVAAKNMVEAAIAVGCSIGHMKNYAYTALDTKEINVALKAPYTVFEAKKGQMHERVQNPTPERTGP